MKTSNKKKANDGAVFTFAPLEAGTGVDAEFVDFRGLQARFSIARSTAYSLISAGLIHSISLRREGTAKSRRLISVASVREFLQRQPTDVEPRATELARKANEAARLVRREKVPREAT